jgi:D-serine deaminase-like pyridoxal phosphate-dependent protein
VSTRFRPGRRDELPLLVLDDDALRHNIQTLADWLDQRAISHAPHIKTHLSAELTRRQLAAGAWGVTVASPRQARWAADFGAQRILIANEVLDPAGLRTIAELQQRGLWITFLLDSTRGVQVAETVLDGDPVPVLIELGSPGARSGCRDRVSTIELASAVHSSPRLLLAGVETYEGSVPGTTPDERLANIDKLLLELVAVAEELAGAGLFDTDEVILSAGGSTYFDRAATILGQVRLSLPSRIVLRPGAYITHDHLLYRDSAPFGNRLPEVPAFRAAATLWCRVLSRPEPGLAIIGAGKRDCAYDAGLPMVIGLTGDDGTVRDADGITVSRLNDQHGYLDLPPGCEIEPGDLVQLGLSHPCTILDKVDEVPVFDAAGRLVEIVRPVIRRRHPAEPGWS